MKYFLILLLASVLTLGGIVPARALWVGGYYPGWEQIKLPPSKLRFDAMTHLFHFSGTVLPDGSLDLAEHDLTPPHMRATVAAAHGAGRKIIFVVGGAQRGPAFGSATSAPNRAKFVGQITDIVTLYNYDGVDVDWEPLVETDNANYRAFIVDLRGALRARNPDALLTAATTLDVWENPKLPEMFAGLAGNFDQINVMTYDMAGPWPGWVAWHNAPLFDGGKTLPGGAELTSMDRYARAFEKAGVPREKLGVGLAFYGVRWTGVCAPLQSWGTPPAIEQLSYADIMGRYYAPAAARYDEAAAAPYLSFGAAGGPNQSFVSYTDAPAITTRLHWMRAQKLGGCIVWEIAQDLMPDGSQPLADALAKSIAVK